MPQSGCVVNINTGVITMPEETPMLPCADQLAAKLGSFGADLRKAIDQSVEVSLAELAYGLHLDNERTQFSVGATDARPETLAIVTESPAELV